MRILTVRQPWAWAIIHGGKDVENRVRNIAGDYRGPVAIHAGQAFDDAGWDHPVLGPMLDNALRDGPEIEFTAGAILGVVRLWAVHPDRDAGNCCPHRPSGGLGGSPWAERGVWHLCLTNPRPLAETIPYRGALGLRRLDDDTTARIRAQIGESA